MDGVLQVFAPAARVAGAQVHRGVDGARVGAGYACIHLDQVADVHGVVEADAAGVDRHGALAGPLHGAGQAGLVDPFHGGAAVDVAAPVHVGGFGHEAVHDARGGGVVGVGLRLHLRLDGLAQPDAGLRGIGDAALLVVGGHESGHCHGLVGAGVLGHEDHEAVAGSGEHALAGVGGEHLVDNVHG